MGLRSKHTIAQLEDQLEKTKRDHREVFDAALEMQQARDQLLALCDGVERVLLQSGDARPGAISIDQIRDILKSKPIS
jgi:hypothetical protein